VKRGVIAVATVLLLTFSAPALATEEVQPSEKTDTNFEQVKADSLKRIDDRIDALNKEKACLKDAKNTTDLRECRMKTMGFRRMMRKRVRPSAPETQVPSQEK
jgi:hypothetical protein